MSQCALCGTLPPGHPIKEGEKLFCCPGCHAVYNILSAKKELLNFHDHPLFKEALQSGLISNPYLIEEIRKKRQDVPNQELQKIHFEIQDMWCPSCAEVIKLILLREKGVRNCVVDYATDLASIEFIPRYISKERILNIIQALGYRPASLQDPRQKAVSRKMILRLGIATFFSFNIMMLAYPLYATYFNYDDQGYGNLFAWTSCFASLPVFFYSAWPIIRRFISSIRVGILGMETLVVMAVTAAFTVSLYELIRGGTHVYFDSMTVIITLVLLGKIIESKSKFSARESLVRLSMALPRRGRKSYPDGTQKFVPIKDISIGDVIHVLMGEKIVLDGVVIEGNGTCDESLMTGESLPVKKRTGDNVLSGTLLKNGWIKFRVTKTQEESALRKIIEMVEKDIGHKTVFVRKTDTIVRWFVPVVIGIAIFTAMITGSFIQSISVLLISCPCAIGIAAPLAESQVINGMANLGAIVRNRKCLSLFGKESLFVFDKTGTVTEGHFQVLSGLEHLSQHEKQILKGLTAQSNHPISVTLVQSIDVEPIQLSDTEELVGLGIRGYYENHSYILGSMKLMEQQGIKVIQSESNTSVFFGKDNTCITRIDLGDRIRPEIKEVIASLKPTQTILLSGDSQTAVEAIALTCGFDKWYWEQTPLQKRDYIDILRQKGHIVAMLGDGINDSPALSGADIGISVVSATDTSIQVSDILLTTDLLNVLPKMRTLARKGQAIVSQNLFWAFFYNIIGIGLATTGYLTPLFSAFAMVASSLIVIFNTRRI